MKQLVGLVLLLTSLSGMAQVDTAYIYNPSTPYGTLDIRIRKSSTRFYYLQENVTFSFRESSPGVKTNTFQDMTSWNSNDYTQGNMREKNGSSDIFVMNYRLLFPLNYNASYSEGYPLIVMLHGAGERGNCWDNTCHWSDRLYKPTVNSPAAPTTVDHPLLNNDQNLAHGGLPHLNARNLAAGKLPDDPTLDPRAFPGLILFPQNLNGWESTPMNDMLRLVRLVIKKYNIDPNRIYVHGLSNGGYATFDAIKRAPWLFAAALPMSPLSDASINSKFLAPTVATIPLWTFQGGQDTNPLPSKTESSLKKFREAGMDVRYSLYPNLGHGTWNTAYAEPDFFSWMLSKNKSKIHVFFNNTAICPSTNTGVKLGYAAGFLAYQWEKDGVIIPGATSNEFTAMEPGVYRARFSRIANPNEADWNDWSQAVTVTVSTPAKPQVEVIGTHLMRGPDSHSFYNTVYLKSIEQNSKYYWYKNGVLVNVPNTSLDDTTRTYTIYGSSSSSNGKFTLITRGSDNCPSPASDTTYLFFGNSAPFIDNVNLPTNFTGSAISNSIIDVTWQDNSSIETGYEIWRRKPGDFFRLAGKVGPDITYFRDERLEPSVAYDYKIRAVTLTARSNYAPSNSKTTNLVITTLADTQAPTSPLNLVVTENTINSISLSWSASTDDTGIRRYLLSYGDTTIATTNAATTFTLTGLPMNIAYSFTVAAEDLGGNISAASNSVVGSTYVTGLTYGHSTGAWTDLDQITNWNTPEFTGKVANITLAPRTQEDFFNFEFKGYLYINTGGNYEFRTTSDDGSRLTLNGLVIVDNDGTHGNVTVTSAVQTLSSGPQTFNVKYFEYTGGNSLTVQYRGADTNWWWVTIPDNAFRTGNAPPTVSASVVYPIVLPETQISDEIISVNVFPNPSTADNIHVTVRTVIDGPVDVKMVDMMGRPFFRNTFSKEHVEAGAKISPSSALLPGMYVIIVNQGNATSKKKIIVRD
jgi:hypothetical protein